MNTVTDNDLKLFSRIIYKRMGISFPETKHYLLRQKLHKIMIKTSYHSLMDLYEEVKEGHEQAIEILIRFITTNHTFFFREKDHFEYLAQDIRKRGVLSPVIWCAASSTGEEVYSIVILLLENGIYDFKIIATDIDRDVLRHMKEGVYTQDKFVNMNRYYQLKYFDKIQSNKETLYRIKYHCRKNVVIKRVNLIDNLRFEKSFNYIFCRNVMIYFDVQRREQVVKNLMRNLNTGGCIFTGHSESLLSAPHGLINVYPSVYMKKG